MSSTKRYWEEVESRGWNDIGTTVCTRCLVDDALVAAIELLGGQVRCDYCGRVPTGGAASAPFETLLALVLDGLTSEYEDPIESMAWTEGEYVGLTIDTDDLLMELEVTDHDGVLKDLCRAIHRDRWCQIDPYAASPSDALKWGWQSFRDFVKHRRRFTFLTEDRSPWLGAGEIPMHALPAAVSRSVSEAGLVVDLPAGSSWWRLRPHPGNESYSTAADIGPASHKEARDNRMSPKGIGFFYGSSTPDGARAEVAGYADQTQHGSMGQFRTTRAYKVVDLRSIPAVPSVFDPERRSKRPAIKFLHGFVDDARQVSEPSDVQKLDYVPTQVIAETFRFDLPVDGILWRSTRDESTDCCVLFFGADQIDDLDGQDVALVMDPDSVQHLAAPIG